MYLASNDKPVCTGIVIHTDTKKPVLTKIYLDEADDYTDDDNDIAASISFTEKYGDSCAQITFFISKFGGPLAMDGMEVDYATLDIEQEGDDDDDFHYVYAPKATIYFSNGNCMDIKLTPLPSNNLIQALRIVFMKIIRNAD